MANLQEDHTAGAIKNNLDAYEKKNEKRTETVIIRNQPTLCPVINLNLDNVYLNHRNHRLAAQLIDYQGDKSVLQDPKSEKAQRLIKNLLSQTEEFGNLKEEIKAYKQRDPGLITREGLLVNGNTRYAALLELKEEGINSGIDVAVLPENIEEQDIVELEMNLQMMSLTHQKYTFTNQLIFMNQYYEKTKNIESLAKHMGWRRQGKAKVEKYLEVYKYIQDIRALSTIPIAYTTFDGKETHLFDLYSTINSKEYAADPVAQERVKNLRILAIFLNLNKDQVREIPSEFLDEMIEKRSLEGTNLGFLKDYFEDNEPDEIDDSEDTQFNSKKLLKDFLNQPEMIDSTGQLNQDIEGKFAELATEMKDETDRIVRKERQKTRNQELHTNLRGIRLDIQEVTEKIGERIGVAGFKTGDFEYELKKAKDELERLNKEYKKLKP